MKTSPSESFKILSACIVVLFSLTCLSCHSYKPLIKSNSELADKDDHVDSLIPGKYYQLLLADGRNLKIMVTKVDVNWIIGEVKDNPYQLDRNLVRDIKIRKVSALKTSGLVVGIMFIGVVAIASSSGPTTYVVPFSGGLY